MSVEFSRSYPHWTIVRADDPSAPVVFCDEKALWTDSVGLLSLYRTGHSSSSGYRLRFNNQITVDLLLEDKALIETARPEIPKSTRDHFLADQVLPRMIAHGGQLVLHAGATIIGHRAVALLGPSGSGKSTMVASFDQAGHELIGDDALIVSFSCAVPSVRPVYRSLRLLPDSIDRFFPGVPTSDVAHYTPKQRVRVGVTGEHELSSVPLRAIFVLAGRSQGDIVSIRPLSIAEACMAIIENSFMLDPTDMTRARARLQSASLLARQVEAFAISYPREYERLEDVRDAIVRQMAVVQPSRDS